ncbi:MAG: S9 family peptidase [Gemmatimonadetes bacterium]|nr:S9 family peptidase [Gemmatimonadota bacterium]
MKHAGTLVIALSLSAVFAQAQQPSAPRDAAARLTSIGSLVGADGPQWMPDGSRILFPSSQGGGLAIWSVSPEGGAATRVTENISPQIPRVSPRGDRIAYLSDKGGSPELWVWSVPDKRDVQLTRLGARINSFTWAPDGSAIAFSALRYGQFDVWTVAGPGGEIKRLTTDQRYEVYPTWTPDSRNVVYVRADDRWADHDVMIVPASGGTARVLTSDKDLFDYGTLGTRSRFGYPLVSPDGKSVLFRSHRSGWLDYWIAPMAGGPVRQLAAEDADQSDARWSPDGQSVVYIANRNGTQQVQVGAVAGGRPRAVVPLETGVAANPEWSPDGKRVAFTLATPTHPADLYVVAADGAAKPVQLTSSITANTEQELLKPEKITYQSDQFTISAYVYRPPALRSGDRVPGIVYVHGGPTGQFSDTYALQPQFLAHMGYVVILPNIRGSSGYGKTFEDANNPCWTRCDLNDVVAAADYLKALPYVNSSAIGITGISYGGIMSLAAVVRAPDVFQASMPQSGYANWISFQDYNAELQHTKLLAYEWGPYPDSAAVYRRNSSIFEVKNVKAPVFLVHGIGKETAWRPGVPPIIASQEYALALEKEFKVVKYKTYPGETYYVSGRENSRQLLLDMLDFFDQYLKTSVAGPAAAATFGRQ